MRRRNPAQLVGHGLEFRCGPHHRPDERPTWPGPWLPYDHRVTPSLRIGPGDLSDGGVQRLISPDVLALLSGMPAAERLVTVAWVADHPMAAVAGRIDHPRRVGEVLCIGAERVWPEFDPSAEALRAFHQDVSASGFRTVFDPDQPPDEAVATALAAAGFRAHDAHWLWFDVRWDQATRMRSAARFARLPQHRLISELSAQELAFLTAHGNYSPHPSDVGELSPVLLTRNGEPIALMIARRTGAGLTLHWGWVQPQARGRGVVLQAGAIVYDLIAASGTVPPIRFRVLSTNRAMMIVLAGPLRHVLTPAPPTTTWVAQPSVSVADRG